MDRRVTRSLSAASNGKTPVKNGSHGKDTPNNHAAASQKPQETHVCHGSDRIKQFVLRTFFPLFLMAFSPNLVIMLWYTAAKCDGSFYVLYQHLTENGLVSGVVTLWWDIHIASTFSVCVILGYMLLALLLMIVLPGPRAEGPVTPKGNIPVYKDNGFYCYCVTMAAFAILAFTLRQFGYSVSIIYDRFDEFLGTLTIYSHLICISLHAKGLLYPSSSDCGTTGNLIFDYYWGTELYPRVFGVDIKVFTNCRFGMTVWPLLVCVFAIKNYELYGFVDSTIVSAVLQMIYFTKFFWWESGYMRTIDIMQDRAGFYICWGCLAYIPGLYASVSMYLTNHPVRLGPFWSCAILVTGLIFCTINYLADKQKLDVRRSNGECLIWGKKAKIIRAKYRVESGKMHESLLLVCGYWGLARHFHYVPELMLALSWTVPAMLQNVMPYTYFIWLVILLTHRTYRDDTKCQKKYGRYWEEYKKQVPYKMLQYIF